MSNDLNQIKEDLRHRTRWRRRLCRVITLGHHWYEPAEDIEVRSWDGLTQEELENDVGFEKIGSYRMCRICYVTEIVNA